MLGVSACYSARSQAPVPVPLRLASPTEFVLEFATDDRPTTQTCVARRADVELTAINGDTLRFSSARVVEKSPEHPTCPLAGAGRVVVSKYPDLRSERAVLREGRTWLAILLVLPMALATALLFAVATTYGGT